MKNGINYSGVNYEKGVNYGINYGVNDTRGVNY